MDKGIQVVHPNQFATSTAQTSGMQRMVAIGPETTGNQNLWVGVVKTLAGTTSGWHHHGDCETAIYVLSGRARFSWGSEGRATAEVGPGDFLSVPPNVIHKEQAIGDEPVVFIVARACSGITVVNVDGPGGG